MADAPPTIAERAKKFAEFIPENSRAIYSTLVERGFVAGYLAAILDAAKAVKGVVPGPGEVVCGCCDAVCTRAEAAVRRLAS